MAYPKQIDSFTEKLNKKQDGGVYGIEEQIPLSPGTAYESFLIHDNAIVSSIRVFTGPKLTGEAIASWTVSTPEDMPWKRSIRIFAQAPVVYVTYETPGDQVEAEDVNVLQDAVTAIETELERYKARGMIDGGQFREEE